MADVMLSAPVEDKPEPAPPALPDYLLSPNAVFKDEGVQWRYGKAPDYSKTRKVWEEGRKMRHAAGSLEQIVENLVKNWEVEASFKPRLSDWRTVDPERYTFAMSGGPPQSAEHMLKVGTYNAIIAPNEFYDPSNSDFASSHKTFKRMMPTFAWEVMEVFSGLPRVVFRWRHWGMMKNDYVGFNNKGQKVTAKAHGGLIEIFGTTVAVVDDQTRVLSLDTYMDSLDMFRQIAPHGVVNMEPMSRRVDLSDALGATVPNNDGVKIAEAHDKSMNGDRVDVAPENVDEKHISNSTGQPAENSVPSLGACPFLGSSNMNGVEAPHPLPPQTYSQNGDALSSGTSPNSADTEFADAVMVEREAAIPELLSPMPTASQADGPRIEQKASKKSDTSTQQGAEMDVDAQNLVPATSSHLGADDTITDATAAMDVNSIPQHPKRPASALLDAPAQPTIYSSSVTGDLSESLKAPRREGAIDESAATGTRDAVDAHLEESAETVHPHPKDVEEAVRPTAGEAGVADADAEETIQAKEEMSEVREGERVMVMNRE